MTEQLAGAEPRPIAEGERIASLDVLRGFAIFGIFMVNIAFFSMPLFEGMDTKLLAEAPLADQAVWLLVKALFEIKFITLFSLLFGVGLVVQMNRIEGRGGAFVPVYLRRIALLAVIGLVHGLLVWYGDILFMYAVAGALLLICRSWSVKQLVTAGAIAFAVGGMFFSAAIGLGALDDAWKEEAAAAKAAAVDVDGAEGVEDDEGPWDRFLAAMEDAHWIPGHPRWSDAEAIAYREGPFLAVFIVRGVSYAAHVFFAGIFSGFWLRIIAVFLFGAAMMKANFFAAENRRWHRHLLVLGLLVGLPLEVAVALSYPANGWAMGLVPWLGETVHYFSSMALTLGMVGGVCLIVHSKAMQVVTFPLAAVGRMALTNYLGQSVIATFIMYWWGLGLFGEFSRAQQLGLVVAIFIGQIIFSVLWLRLFRFGPMEWLWRTATYGRLPAMRR